MFPFKPNSSETQEYLKAIVNGERHENYDASIEHAREMGVHVFGDEPLEILETYRPRESPRVREYRLQSYEPVTKAKTNQVISILKTIFNDKLYLISFPDTDEGKDFENYVRKEYPFYTDIMTYVNNVLMKYSMSDPNAVMLIAPTNVDAEQDEMSEPVPVIYCSDQVVDLQQERYITMIEGISDPEELKKLREGGQDGMKIMIVDDLFIQVYRQNGTGDDVTFTLVTLFEHGIGIMPAFRLGGTIEGKGIPYIFKSFLDGVVPHWNNWIRYNSDIMGSLVEHIHPKRWEMESDCPDCGGEGYYEETEIDNGHRVKVRADCETCNGTGKCGHGNNGPFDVTVIKQQDFTADNPPITPPGGFIESSSAINAVQELVKERNSSVVHGLEAVNMDILAKIGEIQSGVAKQIDRQPLHDKLFEVGSHTFDVQIFNMLNITNRYRYLTLVRDINDNMPNIQKPVDFDILSIQELTEEISSLTSAGVDSNTITAVTKDMNNKRFATSPDTKNFLNNVQLLDPHPNKSADDKFTEFQNGVITKESWVISANINEILKEAVNETPDFYTLSYEDKQKKIRETETFKQAMDDSGGTKPGAVPVGSRDDE